MISLPACELEYIYEPLSPYRRAILELANRFISMQSTVLDLCNGGTGFYWAMSYLDKATTLRFAERTDDLLELSSNRVSTLSPSALEEHFSDLLPNAERWLESLHEKLNDFSLMDPWINQGDNTRFDAILCIEPFGSAQTIEELGTLVRYCKKHLTFGGRLIGCSLNYDVWNDSLEALSQDKLIGRLNPDETIIRATLEQAGLEIIHLETLPTAIKNHSQARYFCAELPRIA